MPQNNGIYRKVSPYRLSETAANTPNIKNIGVDINSKL